MRAVPFALIPLPARTVSDPPRSQPVPYPPAKRHGSHGGSYGINKSGAHAPQLPSLLPSAATSHPFASSPLRPTTSPPFQLTPLFSYRCPSLYLAFSIPPSSPSPPPSSPPCATIMHRDPSRHRYGFRSFPSTYDFESRQLPSPRPLLLLLMYPSFLKLRLKLYNEHALYRVSRHNLLSLFLTSWDTQNTRMIQTVGKPSLSRGYSRTRYRISITLKSRIYRIYRISANLH